MATDRGPQALGHHPSRPLKPPPGAQFRHKLKSEAGQANENQYECDEHAAIVLQQEALTKSGQSYVRYQEGQRSKTCLNLLECYA